MNEKIANILVGGFFLFIILLACQFIYIYVNETTVVPNAKIYEGNKIQQEGNR